MILYNYDKNSGGLLIKLKGCIDDYIVPEIRFCCNQHKQRLRNVILDCKSAIYIDSSFIPFLIKLRKDAVENNFGIVFCNMNDTILHEFRLLNLHKLFSPIYDENQLTVSWQLSL